MTTYGGYKMSDKRNELYLEKKRYCRQSNLELFRIITMIVIVAHHYCINSGLVTMVYESKSLTFNDVFILLFGWGGKTGINCFVLITGYFMCTSNITFFKYIKLIGAKYFYTISIFLIFLLAGYTVFSTREFLNVIFPFFDIGNNFTSCFLLFYLFIPFLNKLISNLCEKEHLILLALLISIYTILPSLLFANVQFNYVTWFIVLYLIASYIRLYPKTIFDKTKLWGIFTIISLISSWLSVALISYVGRYFGITNGSYFFVSEANKILALITAICCFLFFKNLKIKQSKFINVIASSTFGVLLIHANSDSMRNWLWRSVLKVTHFYDSNWLVMHALLSVTAIFVICVMIDQLRIKYIEKPFMIKIDNWLSNKKILNK